MLETPPTIVEIENQIISSPSLYGKKQSLMITVANGLTDTQSFVYGVSLPEQNVIADNGALDDDFAMDVSICMLNLTINHLFQMTIHTFKLLDQIVIVH
jgi:hypothetical protein